MTLPYPALHATHGGIWIAHGDGRVEAVGRGSAIARAAETPMIMLNAPLVGNRLGYPDLNGLDLLELFAFVHPARFAVPTPKGLAHALDLEAPEDEEAAALVLRRAAADLLGTLGRDWPEREGAWASAQALYRLRWTWAGAIAERLARPEREERWLFARLPEWEETGGRPQPRPIRLDLADTALRLEPLVGEGAEVRDGQRDYAAAAASVFDPRRVEDQPNVLLAEAGTGIGKTLGYLAPASLWAEQADGAVWISTYTKALQRQLDREGARLFPDAAERKKKIVIRKGRENYLCLLNLEDALQGGFAGRAAILAQLAARGPPIARRDMVGGDLPGWRTSYSPRGSGGADDRRRMRLCGCRITGVPSSGHHARAGRRPRHRHHALVMVTPPGPREGGRRPGSCSTRATTSSTPPIRLRRRFTPGGDRCAAGSRPKKAGGRRRGLARGMDVASYDEAGALASTRRANGGRAARRRLAAARRRGRPRPVEALLAAVRGTVYARATAQDAGYGLETELAEPDPVLVEAAAPAVEALEQLLRPLVALAKRLEAVLEDAPDWLDAQARARVEGAIGGLSWRVQTLQPGSCWRRGSAGRPTRLRRLARGRASRGREYYAGLHRHWLDPTRPFAETVLKPALACSSLRHPARGADGRPPSRARGRSISRHRGPSGASPFDYAAHSEVLVVTDVRKGDLRALAAAMRG